MPITRTGGDGVLVVDEADGVGQHGGGGQILDLVAHDAFLGGDGVREEDFLFCDFSEKIRWYFARFFAEMERAVSK